MADRDLWKSPVRAVQPAAPPLRGSVSGCDRFPGLTPWADLCCPCGAPTLTFGAVPPARTEATTTGAGTIRFYEGASMNESKRNRGGGVCVTTDLKGLRL